jgi:ribosome-associated protein
MPAIESHQFAVEAARIASDDKCEDVVVLDLRGRSSVTDYFVIATGTSDRQMAATADHIDEHAHKLGVRLYGNKRLDSPVWVLLDYVDTVIHIFDHDHREYYDLELLWGDAPKIEWARTASA